MSNTGASSSGWVCPTCNRHVPGKIDRCRCGSARVDANATSPAPDAAANASPRGTRAVIEAAVLCLVIAAGVYYYASVQIVPTAQRPSLTTAGGPASRNGSILPRPDNVIVTHHVTERTATSEPAVTRSTSGDLPEPS